MNERILNISNKEKEINYSAILDKLTPLISEKFLTENVCVLSISGASASGKSTISTFLANSISDCSVLDMDDYLRGWEIGLLDHDSGNPNKPYFARLNPGVYNLEKLYQDLLLIKNGQSIQKSMLDDITREPVGTVPFKPSRVLILDGIYSLESPFLEIGDIPILVEASLHDRLLRKMVRNGITYKQNINEIIKIYLSNDEPTYPFYRDALRTKAKFIVNNPLDPTRDFGDYEDIRNFTKFENMYNMTPKVGYGLSHPDDQMRIVVSENKQYTLQYAAGNRMLINTAINPETIRLLENYYDIR